jgi:hypothetical protein
MSYQRDNIILDENQHDIGLNRHAKAELPALPLQDELNWSGSQSFSVPPINCMLNSTIISARLKSQAQKNAICVDSKANSRFSISAENLTSLGLPNLPKNLLEEMNRFDPLNVKSVTSQESANPSDKNKIEYSNDNQRCTAMSQYGTDEKALGRVLVATSLLIERMSTQSAVDCLIEMPVWMRNIFIARFGVSRVVGVMLASRLDAAGETSLVGPDGEASVHNIPGPLSETLSEYQLVSDGSQRESALDQLVMVRKTRNIGVKIKNNNKIIHQMPIQRSKFIQKIGSR